MPVVPSPVGLAYYVGVKFAGYTMAGAALRHWYGKTTINIWKIGAARTAIGMGAGFFYGYMVTTFPWLIPKGSYYYTFFFLGLLPVRFVEWFLLLHLFIDEGLKERSKAWKAATGGTALSYCLDAIGISLAHILPGGIWTVC